MNLKSSDGKTIGYTELNEETGKVTGVITDETFVKEFCRALMFGDPYISISDKQDHLEIENIKPVYFEV